MEYRFTPCAGGLDVYDETGTVTQVRFDLIVRGWSVVWADRDLPLSFHQTRAAAAAHVAGVLYA